ncbi:YHS domain-containing (seleno)protein [Chitinibacter sp. FCG-7]|uniref:YHS domain-containing (Seleno)protein n=1 Tax=Chitinibacter mangrovi TaxID=3153927 RepID=A0AAU7F8J9_9NEIS
MFRKSMLASCLALSCLLAVPAMTFAFNPSSNLPVNVDDKGIALRGYDPISYFSGKPAQGDSDYKFSYEGGTYYFVSKANLEKFKSNPAQYAPRFGGFCAQAVAKEKKVDSDPLSYKIVDGYLFLTAKSAYKDWTVNVDGYVKQAYVRWPDIKNVPPKGL